MSNLRPEYKLDPHQQVAVDFIMSRPGGGTAGWLDVGLGKSVVATECAAEWMSRPGANRCLITCPAGLVEDWRTKLLAYAGITATLWDENPSGIGNGWRIVSHTLLQEPKKTAKVKRRNRVPEIIKWCPDIIINDEAHRLKSYKAAQTKGLERIVRECRPAHRLALTGTPTTQINPEELRPQLLFVDRPLLEKHGVADWMGFRKKFCKIEKEWYGGTAVEKVVGYKNKAQLDELLANIAICQSADLLKLPPQMFDTTYYRMSARASKYYRKMAVSGSILEPTLEVVTSNALDRAVRCFQIRSGFVADFEHNDHDLDNTLDTTVVEMCRNTPMPLLCVYRFRHTGDRLEAALKKEGYRIGHIRGGVEAGHKSYLEQHFQAGHLDIILGQYQAISLGLTFTRGSHIIFAEPTFSLEEWTQTLGRIHRRGQTKTCFYHRVIENSTMDQDCYTALANKEDFADKLTRGLVRIAA